ncbi:hypothetical protein CR513_30944, partial [Mucuna pruriens]
MMNYTLNSSTHGLVAEALGAHAPRSQGTPCSTTPLLDGIIKTPLPKGLRGMHLDKYNSTIDLDKHLANYLTQVNLFSNEDAVLCQIFPTSLNGSVLHWYTKLPTNLIDSFETLKKKFGTKYSTSRPHHLPVNLRQGESESLRSFVAQFLNISVKIRNFNPDVALHSIIMALKPGPFYDSLCKLPPKDMDDLRTRASGYIQMEEMVEFRDSVCVG